MIETKEPTLCAGVSMHKSVADILPNEGKNVLDAVTFMVNEQSVRYFKHNNKFIDYDYAADVLAAVNVCLDNILPKEIRIGVCASLTRATDGSLYLCINPNTKGIENVGYKI